LHETNRQLLRNQRRLEEDLKAAAVIQASLLPPAALRDRFEEVEFAWAFRPCQQIGGDVFHVQRLDPDHLGISIVDVAGHGVPAAMITVSVSQCLNPTGGGLLKDNTPDPPHYRLPGPAEVLRRLDAEFPVERFDKYFTMAYLLLDTRTGRLRYSRAAHPCPVLSRAGGGTELLEEGGTIIGLGGEVPYEEGSTVLRPGDRVYLFTDGIPEHPDPAGERYGSARLRRTLEEMASRPIAEACDGVLTDVHRHSAGLPADDDITIVGLEYRGPATKGRAGRRR
jgi:sigma-B regulation protein RsbU (phosphoserine phosphatase)